jgi:hypothetical protein
LSVPNSARHALGNGDGASGDGAIGDGAIGDGAAASGRVGDGCGDGSYGSPGDLGDGWPSTDDSAVAP